MAGGFLLVTRTLLSFRRCGGPGARRNPGRTCIYRAARIPDLADGDLTEIYLRADRHGHDLVVL